MSANLLNEGLEPRLGSPYLGGMKDLNALMQQAQAMQQKLQDAQAKMAETTAEGTSGGGLVSIALVSYRPGHSPIDVRECLDEALWMTTWEPRGIYSTSPELTTAEEHGFCPVRVEQSKTVRIFLAPVECAIGPVDTKAEVIAFAGRHL